MKKKQNIDWTNILIKISKDIEKYPPSILAKKHGITRTNFGSLCKRFPKLMKINKNLHKNYLNDEKAFNYTRYLVTDILKLKVNEKLPRLLPKASKMFFGPYCSIIVYARKKIKKDSFWKNFSATSYLVCGAFSEKFLPYQFEKGNNFKYFDSKINIFKALLEVFKLKNNINLEEDDIDSEVKYSMIMDRRGTFSDPNLKLYGIQRRFWSKTFSTKKLNDVRIALTEYLQLNSLKTRDSTKKIINTLRKNNIKTTECAVCGETRRLEYHHIINIQHSHVLSEEDDINDHKNLIPLCIYHHDDAKNINLNSYYKKNGFEGIKNTLIKRLKRI